MLMEKIFKVALIIGVAGFLFFSYLFITDQTSQLSLIKEQTKIQREAHILNLYAEYRSNIDNCRQDALSQDKDEEFIKANCLDVINSSLIGDLLREWGKADLLITK